MRRGEGCIDQGDGGGGGERRRRRRRRIFIMLNMSLNVSNAYEGSVVEEDGEPLTRSGSRFARRGRMPAGRKRIFKLRRRETGCVRWRRMRRRRRI
jgi:hypothetical protein